jgi:hypothetical protein
MFPSFASAHESATGRHVEGKRLEGISITLRIVALAVVPIIMCTVLALRNRRTAHVSLLCASFFLSLATLTVGCSSGRASNTSHSTLGESLRQAEAAAKNSLVGGCGDPGKSDYDEALACTTVGVAYEQLAHLQQGHRRIKSLIWAQDGFEGANLHYREGHRAIEAANALRELRYVETLIQTDKFATASEKADSKADFEGELKDISAHPLN